MATPRSTYVPSSLRRELIGKGSFKTVYKAYNEEEGLEVAWNEVLFEQYLCGQRSLWGYSVIDHLV